MICASVTHSNQEATMDTRIADMPDYVLVYPDGANGQEHEFQAINDEQAMGLMQKSHPEGNWVLYRKGVGQRIPICAQAPECPPIPVAPEQSQPPMAG